MSEPVIRTEGLVKEFPVASKTLGEPRKVLHAVTNVSLSVPKGGIFGIVGESGCGKSTLGRCLLRLETITKGSVFFQGRDITNLSGKDLLPLRKNMQMIFQNPYGSFDPKQKIGAALTEVAAVHKMDAAQAQEKIHNLLEQINLPQDALNRIPSEMSGGQLQRLAIARALLLDPAFIVADEPVSALDVSVQAQILNLLMDLREAFSLTMLFISHEMTVVRHLCDQVAVMYLGTVVEQADSEELFRNLLHPYTQSLMSAIPTLDPDHKKQRIVLQGDIPSAIDLPKGCPFADRCPQCQTQCKESRPPCGTWAAGIWWPAIWCEFCLAACSFVPGRSLSFLLAARRNRRPQNFLNGGNDMNRFSRLLALLMSLCLMVSLLASCGGNTDSGGSTADAGKDTFTVALDSDIVKLDPAFAYDFTTNPVVNQITQGLLTFDEDNQLQPMLASSWEQKDDLTYVYQIRDDVTFSDGSAMTMDDVLYSMNRIKDPATASYLSWMYDNVASIEQTGDWELTVTLSTPDATWQYVPATSAGHVISKAYAEQVGDKLGTPEGGLVGTGPYKYVSWQNGSSVQLTRNENYWNKDDAPYFDNLTFKIITEDTTRVTALQTGDVDCTVAPPESMLDVLKGDQNLTLTSSPGFGVSFVAFNTQKEPFNNVKVRQAIYDAIDLDTIQSSLIKDAGEASTALPSSTALFTIETDRWNDYLSKAPKHTYDVEAAKALLAEAGYPDGFTCSLMIADSSLRNSMALAIQEQLAQIGITVNINKVSTDEHTAYQFGEKLDANGLRDYDMIMAGWEADYPDPSGNLTPLYQGGNSSNSAAYQNDEVDKLIADQAQNSDPTQRNDDMFQAFDIITQDVPYVFLYYPVKNIAMNKAYTGVTMNASWIWNIHFQSVHPVSEG